ncbi:hypothetical protein ACIRPT_02785 [Streptomyces sp. NPDC101227]|uniref:hypothetical protein n=1 Tax=Streptomyces sp. NPDC101227 TaxID=3366136 RepID=UPI0038209EF9
MTYPTPGPTPDPSDWLMGGGTKSASFNGPPPITWSGAITTEPVLVQKRDFDTNEPLFWPDGRPKQMLQVNIQTEERDPQDPEDEGVRALYLEYRKANAVRDAVRAAGTRKLEVGGVLALTYTGDDLAAKKGRGMPPKNYSASYTAPDPLAQTAPGDIGAWAAAAPAAPAPQPPAPAAAGIDPRLKSFLESRGIQTANLDQATAEMIAKSLPQQ